MNILVARVTSVFRGEAYCAGLLGLSALTEVRHDACNGRPVCKTLVSCTDFWPSSLRGRPGAATGTGGGLNSHYHVDYIGRRCILLTCSGETIGGDGIFLYRSQTRNSSSQRGDSRGESIRHGSRSEDINHSYSLNVVESVDGIERIVSRSRTSPSPSDHSVHHGRSSGSYSYGDSRSGYRSHTSQFYEYNHGGIKISYPRFP